MTPDEILQKYFGYDSFREHQADIIDTVLNGRDAFVLMPTGSGKSICYQIPSMIRRGVGLIISPLIALMQDQVVAMRQNGIRAEYLNSSLSAAESAQVKNRILSGKTDLLYVAPERLLMESFLPFLKRVPVALFAIDEAHCVSQWGHDFRPEYLRIPDITREFPEVPRIALTATADSQTRREIFARLELDQAAKFVSSFDRPNICYRVQLKNNGGKQLRHFIDSEHPGESGIVYVRTRKRADQIAAQLTDAGFNALPYHAGLDQQVRSEHQRRFLEDEAKIIVATIAFGMGIDKPDVRFVAHLDLPASMEAYYQETGRAGRDGQPADAWMVYSLADVVAMRKLLETSEADEAFKMRQRRKLEALLGFCETAQCRRKALLGYFGEDYPAPCQNCSNCNETVETWDATESAQKALSCVYRTGQRFGAAYLTDVLIGNSTERMQRFGHDRIKTFGVGSDLTKETWWSVFRQLMAAGMLTVNMSEISGFRLTEESWPVLKGERRVRFRKDALPVKTRTIRPKTSDRQAELVDQASLSLFEKLRELRLRISKELGVPPFVVFHDKTLIEMAAYKPTSIQAFLQINGVGEAKAEKYGEQFISAIRESGASAKPVNSS